jgi:hypothetical protein
MLFFDYSLSQRLEGTIAESHLEFSKAYKKHYPQKNIKSIISGARRPPFTKRKLHSVVEIENFLCV